ncbi:MAG TPA: hypothetical protein P5079_10815, partial [Elusimicrobiota bacterium]|nr:hypothetical protein [Elusimicrobiota bacterium]
MKTRSASSFRRLRFFLTAFFALGLLPLTSFGFEQLKLAMERALEERIQSALSKLIDPDQFLVIVKLEPFTADELQSKSKGGTAANLPQYVLPGIPERQSIDNLNSGKSEKQDILWQSRPFIKRLHITLFLDKYIRDDLAQQIEILVKQLVDFNPSRQDELKLSRIVVRRASQLREAAGDAKTPMQQVKFTIEQIKERKDFYWILLGVAITGSIIVFLFGPMLYFLRRFPKILQQAFLPEGGGYSGAGSSGGGGAGSGGGGGTTKLEVDNALPLALNLDAKAA